MHSSTSYLSLGFCYTLSLSKWMARIEFSVIRGMAVIYLGCQYSKSYELQSVHGILGHFTYYPIKNYRWLSPNYRAKRWAYVHLIRGLANHPFNVHYKACKCAYLCILISEASMHKKCIEKYVRLFSWNYFNRENSHYVRRIRIISPCKSDNCRCAKSLVIFTPSIWWKYRNNYPHNWERPPGQPR